MLCPIERVKSGSSGLSNAERLGQYRKVEDDHTFGTAVERRRDSELARALAVTRQAMRKPRLQEPPGTI